MNAVKQDEFNCSGLESVAHPLHGMGDLKLKPPETSEIKILINNLNVTLKFAEKPKSEIQNNVLRMLVSSYKLRITAQ